jgi:hypothetical protein
MTIWPDEQLEAAMIADAQGAQDRHNNDLVSVDCAYHIRALLSRVRELEAELRRVEHKNDLLEERLKHETAGFAAYLGMRKYRGTVTKIQVRIPHGSVGLAVQEFAGL